MSAQEPIPARRNDQPGLIETLSWTPLTGFFLIEEHLARLANSALVLGHAYDEGKIRGALATAADSAERLRVRILLSHDGHIEVTAQAIAELVPGTQWRAAIADVRLDPDDRLLAHKTTRRQFYDEERARLARERGADEAIFLNRRGEVCEGSITTLFVMRDGVLLTPPLTRGLLPGVLRGHLLKLGQAREADVSLADLEAGFLLGNSVRGLIPARLIQRA